MANSDDEDLFALLWLALGSIGAIIAFATAMAVRAWNETIGWLLEHSVLVPGTQSPWLAIPNTNGAGLDVPRCFIVASLVLLVVFGAVETTRRRWARPRGLA